MDEAAFWGLIDKFHWNHPAMTTASSGLRVTALAKMSEADISEFQSILASKLYALDGRASGRAASTCGGASQTACRWMSSCMRAVVSDRQRPGVLRFGSRGTPNRCRRTWSSSPCFTSHGLRLKRRPAATMQNRTSRPSRSKRSPTAQAGSKGGPPGGFKTNRAWPESSRRQRTIPGAGYPDRSTGVSCPIGLRVAERLVDGPRSCSELGAARAWGTRTPQMFSSGRGHPRRWRARSGATAWANDRRRSLLRRPRVARVRRVDPTPGWTRGRLGKPRSRS